MLCKLFWMKEYQDPRQEIIIFFTHINVIRTFDALTCMFFFFTDIYFIIQDYLFTKMFPERVILICIFIQNIRLNGAEKY